jgi:acetate kinase
MDTNKVHTVTVNAGSSSIKLGLFIDDIPRKVIEGTVENIGQPSASLVVHDKAVSDSSTTTSVVAADHVAAAHILTDWLKQQVPDMTVAAIGHRIVHGGPKYYEPQVIDETLLADLRELTPFDPEHLPVEIVLIKEFQELFPGVKQIACFDTAFHHDLPSVARLLPIPRQFEAKGVRRYGFHGLSYAFVQEELRRLEGDDAANGKVIIAHLGSGVSLAAIHNGKSIDTTMGLTPAAGVPMSTRSGDLDPGLALYLSRVEGYDAEKFNDMVNFKSGLLGISETSADMKQLLEREVEDVRAKDAVDLFCYQVKKSIGGLAAALGGIDTLIFTGGMGENATRVRARICDGLEFLGVTLEASRNDEGNPVISSDSGQVSVRVMHTDESVTIAQNVQHILTNKKNMEDEVE